MTRREKIFWAFVGAAIILGFIGLIPSHYQICETNQYTEKEYCSPHQVFPFLFLKIGKLLDAGGVAVTAVFTGVLAVFTARLWISTEKLWQETRESGDRQTQDTRILQRAYVGVAPLGIHPMKEPGKCTPHINIQNEGNLPARKVKWLIRTKFSDNHRYDDFPVDKMSAEGDNVITPHSSMIQGGGIIYAGNDEQNLRQRNGWFLYVWGAIYYDDGFGNARTTRFCHRYNCANVDSIKCVSIAGAEFHSPGIHQEWARFHRFGNDSD